MNGPGFDDVSILLVGDFARLASGCSPDASCKAKVFHGRVVHHNNLPPLCRSLWQLLPCSHEVLWGVLLGLGDVWRQLVIRFLHQGLKIRPKALDCLLCLHVGLRWFYSAVMEGPHFVEITRDRRVCCRRRHGTLPSKMEGKSSLFPPKRSVAACPGRSCPV